MSRKRAAKRGNAITEYAGALVLSTLLVAGLLAGSSQVMPALFSALSYNNEAYFEAEMPAPPGAHENLPGGGTPASNLPEEPPPPSSDPTVQPSPSPSPEPAPAPTPNCRKKRC